MWSRGLPAVFFLAVLLLVPDGARPTPDGVPAGCEEVFAATTRGGASAPSGRVGCTWWGGSSTGVLVEKVIDGDTIVLVGGERVRYVGLDSPELSPVGEPFGAEATRFNRALVEGRRVRLERDVSDRDRFDRLLRYVYVDGILVNAELIREGYAEAKEYRPDTKYQRCFQALQEEARAGGRGMWVK